MQQSPITIRPYRANDAPHLRQLLRHIWGDDETAAHYYRFGEESPADSPRYMHTIIAECDGQRVGFGSLWTARFHPYTVYCGINVHPAWQGFGAGWQMFEQLLRTKPDGRPLQTSTWETSVRGLSFLERNGFTAFRRTYTPLLSVAAVDRDAYRPFAARIAQAGYRTVSLTDLVDSPENRRRVAVLCAEIYQATHQDNPPAHLSTAEWEETVFGQPLTAAGSFVAEKDGEYAAVSLLHPADEPGALELGWRGVAHTSRDHQRDLILALTLEQVIWSAGNGCAVLRAEVDTTNPWAKLLLEYLPFGPAPSWITFRREG